MTRRTAVITGSAGAIGEALCASFESAGYAVVGVDARESEHSGTQLQGDLERLANEEQYRGELIEAIRRAASGPIAVLCNNAAVQYTDATDGIKIRDWRSSLDVNLTAPFLLSQLLLPELEACHGSVVNIASIHAYLTKPGFVTYATTKSALVGLTRAMAVDLGGRVRVNAICPAAIDTPMLTEGLSRYGRDAFEQLSSHHPIGRIGCVNDVAEMALWLASDKSGFVTGACIGLDGGIGARLHDPI